jgi:hypothetical protein
MGRAARAAVKIMKGRAMLGLKFKTIANILGVFALFAFVATPTMSIADASNPAATRLKAKAKPKARARQRVVRAKVRTPQPVQQAPVETVQAPAPEPMPAPTPEPMPQVVEAPAAPAPEPAPVAVAKKGGSGWLLGVLGAAAVVAGIVVATDSGTPASR